jgi:hypothetical protein
MPLRWPMRVASVCGGLCGKRRGMAVRVNTPGAGKRDFIARKGRDPAEVLPAQADSFAGTNAKEKPSACFGRMAVLGRNDGARGSKTMTCLPRWKSVWHPGAPAGATLCVWTSRHKESFWRREGYYSLISNINSFRNSPQPACNQRPSGLREQRVNAGGTATGLPTREA